MTYTLISIGVVGAAWIWWSVRRADKDFDRRIDILNFEADLKQMGEDVKITRLIESEAQRLFNEWHDVEIDYILNRGCRYFAWNPVMPGYCLYSPKIAKYEGVNLLDLVGKRFDELVKNTGL